MRSAAKQALTDLDIAMIGGDADMIADCKAVAKRTQAKLFRAMFDDCVDEIRPQLIRLTALFRLASHGRLISQPWHLEAMAECQKRLSLNEAITRNAFVDLKREELG